MSKASSSARAAKVAPFIVMDVLRQAQEMAADGADVIHMEVGQPFGPAPRKALEAAHAALEADDLGYTQAAGVPPLRERIARHYAQAYGVSIGPERVFVTTGSSAAFVIAFLAAFDAGARVGLANPGYPAYRNILHALNMEPLLLEAGPEKGWTPDAAEVSRLMRSGEMEGLLVASPANPTGTMLSPQGLRALIGAVEAGGGWFISDEIYHGLNYETPARTALEFSDEAIVINSFSKYYCMTGWRIGWMILPERLARPAEVLAQNMFINAPAISQHAALAAFDATEELEERKAVYARNRAFLLDALPQIGFDRLSPADGAFYLYCDVSELTDDSFGFARRMLRETAVAVTPGLDFDPVNGKRFIRFSFCGGREDMSRAVERLEKWMKQAPRPGAGG